MQNTSKVLEEHISPVLAFAQTGVDGCYQTKCVPWAQMASWWDPYEGSATGNLCLWSAFNHSAKIRAHQHKHRPPPWTGWWTASRVQPGAPSAGSTHGAWSRDPTQPLARLKAAPAKVNEIGSLRVQAGISTFASFHFMLFDHLIPRIKCILKYQPYLCFLLL